MNSGIARLIDYFKDDDGTTFIVTKLPKQSLSEYLASQPDGLDVQVIAYIIRKVGAILKKIHKRRIIHRNIALDTIRVIEVAKSDKKGRLNDYMRGSSDSLKIKV
jgi:serine/threonine protein kinase